jgi:hypothetical protein
VRNGISPRKGDRLSSERTETTEGPTAGPFLANLHHYDTIFVVEKLAQDVLELGGTVGAPQSPLPLQELLGFKAPQAGSERVVRSRVEQFAGHQVELQRHETTISK